MPGPLVHYAWGLGTSLPYYYFSDGRFSGSHVLIYATNNVLGPDIGVVLEAGLRELGAHAAASLVLHLFHDPTLFAVTLGAPLAWAYSQLSRRAGWGPALSFRQCLLLVAGGGLAHFAVDNVFEEDGAGHTAYLRFAVATGAFKPKAAADGPSVLALLLLLIALLGGLAHIHYGWLGASFPGARLLASMGGGGRERGDGEGAPSSASAAGSKPLGPREAQARAASSAGLLGCVCALWLLWGAMRVYGTQPRLPVLGEEADLGALIFIVAFVLAPALFCAAAAAAPPGGAAGAQGGAAAAPAEV